MRKKHIEKGLYQNSGDLLWNRTNSQRQFYTAPVGSVPSNQPEFAQWLYGDSGGRVCKSGSIYTRRGVEYTDDSLMCNGYNTATPTNFGLLNGNLMSSVSNQSQLQ